MDTEVKAERPRTDMKRPRTGAVALADLGRAAESPGDEPITVAGVAISNAARPLANEEGLTKLDVVRYHESVADWLLPEIAQRPLSLVRCPAGDFRSCHFRRHPDRGHDDRDGIAYVSIADLRELIASVQGGTFEFHGWGSTLPRIDRPDRITLDLDPDPKLPWRTVREALELTRALLDRLELAWFVKTTGGKGVHFVLPVVRRYDWDEVKVFSRRLAEHLAATIPTLFTATMSKPKRSGRVYVDYLRNGEGATAVASYSLRARPGLPVSMPIAWEALDDDVRGDRFNIGNVPRILAGRRVDPWAGYADSRQSIGSAKGLLK